MRRLTTAFLAFFVVGFATSASAQTKCDSTDPSPVSDIGDTVDATTVDDVDDAVERLRTAARARAREDALDALVAVDGSGYLESALVRLASELDGDMSEEQRVSLAKKLAGMIHVELCTAGRIEGCQGREDDWDAYAADVIRTLDESGATATRGSRLHSPEFLEELAEIANTRFVGGNCVKVLDYGPVAFDERARMLGKARDSYHIMSWSIYDDETGEDLRRQLHAARARGLEDIKIIVDGNTSHELHHRDVVAQLIEEGFQVIRYHDPRRPGDGLHVKLEIADGNKMVADSRNYGDVYSHRGPEGTPKWGDAGVAVSGPAALEADKFFAEVWNEQVKLQGLDYEKVSIDGKRRIEPCPGGTARVAALGHRPGRDQNILLAKLKMLRGTGPGETFDLQNAYLIGFPPLEAELVAAARRGVHLRVFTNSEESIDEPIVIGPGLATVKRLSAGGVGEIYLQKGKNTVHSKFDRAGSNLTIVGSDNYHPRRRYETEFDLIIDDAATNAGFKADFEGDMENSTRVSGPDEVQIPESTLSQLAMKLFYNQL